MENKDYRYMIVSEHRAYAEEVNRISTYTPRDILARYRYFSNLQNLFDRLLTHVVTKKCTCYDDICTMPEPVTKNWQGFYYNGESGWIKETVDVELLGRDHPELLNLVVTPNVIQIANKLHDLYPKEFESAIIKLAEKKLTKTYIESAKTADIEILHKKLPPTEWEKYTKYTQEYISEESRKGNFVVMPREEIHGQD